MWFIPTIIFEIIMTTSSEMTAEEIVSEIPKEMIYVTFPIALGIILKGVLAIRKERKNTRTEDSRKKKSKK